MLKTKSNSRFVCGFYNGTVEIRQVNDLGLLSSHRIHQETSSKAVFCVCELVDGSFVSGSADKTLKNWDETGKLLQSFVGHSQRINRVIELKRDVIVSASEDFLVKIWRVSTGECINTLTAHSSSVYGLEKVKGGMFVSGSLTDGIIALWDANGVCVETIRTGNRIRSMTTLRDGSLVTGDYKLMEIRW